jgi:hypothetical protein
MTGTKIKAGFSLVRPLPNECQQAHHKPNLDSFLALVRIHSYGDFRFQPFLEATTRFKMAVSYPNKQIAGVPGLG